MRCSDLPEIHQAPQKMIVGSDVVNIAIVMQFPDRAGISSASTNFRERHNFAAEYGHWVLEFFFMPVTDKCRI